MSKSKSWVLLACFFVGATAVAQNGYFLHKSISVSFEEITQTDSLTSLEVYQNGIHTDEKFGNASRYQTFTFDSLTGTYHLNYSLTGIGSGSEKNYLKCPELFVKLNFVKKTAEEEVNYFRLIPIIPLVCESSEISIIEVFDIDLNPLLDDIGKVIVIEESNSYRIVDQSDLSRTLIMDKLLKIIN